MYLRTNRHIGTERFLNLEGLIKSLERDGVQDKEVTRLTGILGKGGFVDKGHYWYRLAARPSDGTPIERAAKELELFGVSSAITAKELELFGVVSGGEKDDNVQDQAKTQEDNDGGGVATEQGQVLDRGPRS